VIFVYLYMPNLDYRIDLLKIKKIHRKTWNTFWITHCHVAAVKIWAHFDLLLSSNGQLKIYLFLVIATILNEGEGLSLLKGTHPAKFGLMSVDSEGEALNVIICIIDINRLKKKILRKTWNICWTTQCIHCHATTV